MNSVNCFQSLCFVWEKRILSFSRPVFCGWLNLKGLAKLAIFDSNFSWNKMTKKKHFRYRESWKILSRLLKIETKIKWI